MKTVIYQDRLISIWRINGLLIKRGKRVGKDCPLTRPEIRAYVDQGVVAALKMIKARLQCSLADALSTLNTARGGTYRELKAKSRWFRWY